MMKFFKPQILRYEKIIKFCKKGVVLDFGSSEGELHDYVLKHLKDSKIFSVDFQGKPDIRHDFNNFPYPFKNNYADTIIAGELIEHLLKPYEFLQECYRILKNEGRVILTTPNMIGLQHIIKPEDFWVKNRIDPHIYAWNIEMISKLMEKAGFCIIHKELLNTFWAKNLLFRGICFLFKKIRPTIFIVGKKI